MNFYYFMPPSDLSHLFLLVSKLGSVVSEVGFRVSESVLEFGKERRDLVANYKYSQTHESYISTVLCKYKADPPKT